MIPRIAGLISLSVCMALSAIAAQAPKTPDKNTTAVYGKSVAAAKAPVRESAQAITGYCAYPARAYQILAEAPVPESGDPLHIWVRYCNLALQMKTKPSGDSKTVEFPWNWTRHPEGFAWRKVGTYSRNELGQTVFFMADTKFGDNSGIDAIVITDDADWTPEATGAAANPTAFLIDAPDAANAVSRSSGTVTAESTTPGRAIVTVDYSDKLGTIDPRIFSINNFRADSLTDMQDQRWHDGIAYMAPKLLRLHRGGLVNSWYDAEKDDWKYDEILAVLKAGTPPDGTQRMININTWPAEYDTNKDRRLDPDKVERFARLCADLVRFVNIEQGLGIPYWEVTNEKDFAYWRTPAEGLTEDVAALAELYNAAAAAMREVDPSIKIGGPAACNPLPAEPLIEFSRLAQDQLDFVSFHNYASGTADDTDQAIYDKAFVMAEDSGAIVERLRKIMPHRFPNAGSEPERPLEVHLNEYNICYNWRIKDVRMTNHKGAVFDALIMIELAKIPGMSAANAWNDRDGVYGKMDHDASLRPAAHVYHYFNSLLQGSYVKATSDAPQAVIPFASVDGQEKTLVLVNRTAARQTVTLDISNAAATGWKNATINESGHYAARTVTLEKALNLSPHSVNIYWQK